MPGEIFTVTTLVNDSFKEGGKEGSAFPIMYQKGCHFFNQFLTTPSCQLIAGNTSNLFVFIIPCRSKNKDQIACECYTLICYNYNRGNDPMSNVNIAVR